MGGLRVLGGECCILGPNRILSFFFCRVLRGELAGVGPTQQQYATLANLAGFVGLHRGLRLVKVRRGVWLEMRGV